MGFKVHILRLIYSRNGHIKYVMKLYPEGADGPGTPLTKYRDDAALCEALSTLNVAEPEQERLLSVLHDRAFESFPVDISEDIARHFGWQLAM